MSVGPIPGGSSPQVSNTGGSNNPSQLTTFTTLDSLNSSGTTVSSLKLFVNSQISLPVGQVSLFEFAQEIAIAKQFLRETLNESELKDSTLYRNFYLNVATTFAEVLDSFIATIDLVTQWNDTLKNYSSQVSSSLSSLQSQASSFNSLVSQTEANDQFILNRSGPGWINAYINAYNNPTTWKGLVITLYGTFTPTTSQNTVAWVNANVINVYNSAQANRPNLQTALNNYNQSLNNYNNLINSINNGIFEINSERSVYNLSQLTGLDQTGQPSTSANAYLTYNSQLPQSLPLLNFPIGTTAISPITVSPTPSNVIPLPGITDPGTISTCSILEALFVIWVPVAFGFVSVMNGFFNHIDVSKAQIEAENLYYKLIPGLSIIFPEAFVQKIPNNFSAASGPSGSSPGLVGFSMAFGTNNLLSALSSALFKASALEHQLPLSQRVFGRLQMTTLDLIQKSGLLASLPALGIATSGMGALGNSTESVNVAVAIATLQQLGQLQKSDALSSFINGLLNQLPAYARLRQQASGELASNGIQGLNESEQNTVSGLVNSQIQLSRANALGSTIDNLSLGQIAAFTNTASASMGLSVLAVGLALIGRAIGIPDLAAQVIGNATGTGLTPGLNGYSTVADLLDNPLTILSLKQNLANILTGQGLDSAQVKQVIEQAVNNVILKGGISSFSTLASALKQEFLSAGLSPAMANLLANEASSLLRRDLGLNFLNSAYGKNATNSDIINEIQANGGGSSEGISALNDILSQSTGSFETQREFRDHIFDGLKERGINDYEATYLSNSASNYALNGVMNPPTGVSSSGLQQISDATVTALTGALGISAESAQAIVDQAKIQTLAEGPFSNSDQFAAAFKEQLALQVLQKTGSDKGSQIFDQIITSINSSANLLALSELKDRITKNTLDLLTPSIGAQGAEAYNKQLLSVIFGSDSSQELPKITEKQPVSILNQIRQTLTELKKEAETQSFESVTNQLNQVIATWLKPNAQLGYLLQSIMDGPSTFVSNAVEAQKSSGVNLQIRV